jgi:hypothetical protein
MTLPSCDLKRQAMECRFLKILGKTSDAVNYSAACKSVFRARDASSAW